MAVDGLSVEELEALREQAARRIEAVKAQNLVEAFPGLDELAKSLGLDAAQVARHYAPARRTRGRKPAAQTYRDPVDSDQTWSGRGRRPVWVQAHLDGGGSLESLLVTG